MRFFLRASDVPRRLAIMPGTFNPPTRAHLALGRAALRQVDEVLFVLPRAFPHKPYEGAAFAERVRMLELALEGEERFSLASSEGGLFVEIAHEARAAYGPEPRLSLLCGRDAAERIVGWDYGDPQALGRMLNVFDLLVAARGGAYQAPAQVAGRVEPLEVEPWCDEVSATEVRRRVAAGEPWEHLVPPEVVEVARELYSQH